MAICQRRLSAHSCGGNQQALLKPTGPPDRQRKFLPAGPTPSGKLGLKSALSSTKIRVKVDFGDKYDY